MISIILLYNKHRHKQPTTCMKIFHTSIICWSYHISGTLHFQYSKQIEHSTSAAPKTEHFLNQTPPFSNISLLIAHHSEGYPGVTRKSVYEANVEWVSSVLCSVNFLWQLNLTEQEDHTIQDCNLERLSLCSRRVLVSIVLVLQISSIIDIAAYRSFLMMCIAMNRRSRTCCWTAICYKSCLR